MNAYKGFNKNMTCREFQYEEGKTYETDEAKLCSKGFHACVNPLDCFGYYAPGTSVYHEVEIEDNGERNDDDTKVVGKKITIGAKLSVPELCKLHFEYTKSRCTNHEQGEDKAYLSGGYKSSLAGGDSSSLAGGYKSSLAGGDSSSLAGGNYSSLAGGNGSSLAGGNYSSLAGGDRSSLAGGNGSSLAGGNYSSLAGRGSAESGENSSIIVRGNGVKAKGGLGSVIVIVEEQNTTCDIKEWKAAVVDGEDIKADTWYKLKNGEFVEVTE